MTHFRLPLIIALSLAPLACDDESSTDEGTIDEIVEDLDPQMPQFDGAKADGLDAVAVFCPGHEPSGSIPNYDGLDGSYQRAAAPVAGEPFSLSLEVTDTNGFSSFGEFDRTTTTGFGLPVRESGEFIAAPDNPALGPVLAFDIDADGAFDDLYWVFGLRRSAFSGNVSSLCLASADPEAEAPFMMVRVGF